MHCLGLVDVHYTLLLACTHDEHGLFLRRAPPREDAIIAASADAILA